MTKEEKLSAISNIDSFAARIRYCEANFNRISSGTARKVYDLNDGRVLKLAANIKGIAQNTVEGDLTFSNLFPDQVNLPLAWCKDDKWVVSKKLEPVKTKDITDYFGASWAELCDLFRQVDRYTMRPSSNNFPDIPICKNEEMHQKLTDLVSMFGDTELMAGDLVKASSFGLDKDTGLIKVLDFGLSKAIWREHYMPKNIGYSY